MSLMKYNEYKNGCKYNSKYIGRYAIWHVFSTTNEYGYFEGIYDDVVKHCVDLYGFWGMVDGAYIEPIPKPKKIKSERELKLNRILSKQK